MDFQVYVLSIWCKSVVISSSFLCYVQPIKYSSILIALDIICWKLHRNTIITESRRGPAAPGNSLPLFQWVHCFQTILSGAPGFPQFLKLASMEERALRVPLLCSVLTPLFHRPQPKAWKLLALPWCRFITPPFPRKATRRFTNENSNYHEDTSAKALMCKLLTF